MEILKKDKILFIQTAFIGDAILTLPAIQEFKKSNPENDIDILCIPSTSEIFKCSPFVSNVMILDKRGEQKGIWKFLKFCRNIREAGYKKIYSFHRSFRTAFLILESNVKDTVGFSNASMNYVYKQVVKYNPSDHEVKRNLFLAGFNFQGDDWKILPLLETSSQKVDNFIIQNQLEKGFICIAPGTIWNTKKYPLDYYKEIVDFFTRNNRIVVLLGSKQDENLCNSLLLNEKVISSAGLFNVSESIELLRKATLLISNDSAPAHFAMAADIPVVMLYCSTVPAFGFYPYNKNSSWLSFEKLDCKPCGIHGHEKCPLGHFKCGLELKADLVIKHIMEKDFEK